MTIQKVIFGDSAYMKEIETESLQLIVTSPPYPKIDSLWKDLFADLGCETYAEMHEYLNKIWQECYRILCYGGIMCVNIGDAVISEPFGKDKQFKLYPNHSTIQINCLELGFTILPYILWKKPFNKPNSFLGSGFLPTNAYVTLDCEFILIFRKGNIRKFPPKDERRYASKFTKKQRDLWFSQIWNITGTRQVDTKSKIHTASFPPEIPRRLIQMFSIIGDTVCDPFLGRGTTMNEARNLKRNCIGYEINKKLKPIIREYVDWGIQLLIPEPVKYYMIDG